MKTQLHITIIAGLLCTLFACSEEKTYEKGFSVRQLSGDDDEEKIDGVPPDSLVMQTRPGNVLITGIPNYRLTTVYKVNVNERTKTTYIGSIHYHSDYSGIENYFESNWNYNFIPGMEAAYGYNLVNIGYYDITTDERKTFFEDPVLIKTLYYPAFSKDTLKGEPVNRDYFLVSAYNEDTNEDGWINMNDLRRFYLFDKNAVQQKVLVPENYSVIKSEYDPANDYMYVFAKWDEDQNGKPDDPEPIHVFWIDLANPMQTGRVY